jgi:hypothetical protein
MIQPDILEKLEALSESLQTEVLHYIEFLIDKRDKTQEEQTTKRRVAETVKGMFVRQNIIIRRDLQEEELQKC